MSSGYGHLAWRWLALAVFCTGHGPLQFPAEVWRASRAFYTQAHNWPRLPTCTYWQWHKSAPLGEHIHIQEHTLCTKICICWHTPTLNWTHTYLYHSLSLFCALLWYLNAHWHCSVLLFACTGLNTHISWKKRRRCETEAYNQKLKRTLPDFLLDWAYYKPILVSSLFYPLKFCVHVPPLSLPILFFLLFFSSATALHKHEKGSCSVISAIQATTD